MYLTDKEQSRLLIYVAAELARRRKKNGLKLNYPEALAIISDEILELARAGVQYLELMKHAKTILERKDVMDGVPEMLKDIRLEVQFEDGTKLVVIQQPIT